MAPTRRSFLSLSAVSLAADDPDLAPAPLAEVPSLDSLASDRMTHRWEEPFNPPGLQNEWGHAQATKSVTGITNIFIPPFGCCGVPKMAWTPGHVATCELTIDGRLFLAYPAPDARVSFRWFPHGVERESTAAGLEIRTWTFMPAKRRAVVQEITVHNPRQASRRVRLGFILRAHVSALASGQAWGGGLRGDPEDIAMPVLDQGCLVFRATASKAFSVQGFSVGPPEIYERRVLQFNLDLGAGESRTLHYVNVIGDDETRTLTEYDEIQRHFGVMRQESERAFDRRVTAAFTPGNNVFSGSLPRLKTRSRSLWRLYHTGFASLLYSRIDSPISQYGPAYITLTPRIYNTSTFIWDTSVTALSTALLDPAVLRRLLEVWLVDCLDKNQLSDYTTGRGAGRWYAVNNMGVLRSAEAYLSVTGDFAWLDKRLEGRAVIEHLKAHALQWKRLDQRGVGLADYGGITNLLEVVSTYTHEVAATNAGNVRGMRFVAALLERRGFGAEASRLRQQASALARRIIQRLYVPGRGYWRCGQPDGTYNEVRHAYDFLSVLDNMAGDLTSEIRRQMCDFFWRELATPTWMHALSPHDADSTWNPRADHSWLGAYPAWPAISAKCLLRVDRLDRVARWIKGLGKSANQGTFGQAHIVESAAPPENGGALKSPEQAPYGNDWCEKSGGSFTDLVLEGVFGLEAGIEGQLKASPRLAPFDPGASLSALHYREKLYRVDANGCRPASSGG